MTSECLNDAETGTASSHRISRRAALVTGGVGLLEAVAGSSSPRSAEARQATPVADADHELPAELQLALTDIVLSVLGDANVPGAIVLVSIPGQGMWSIATGLGDVSNATPIRLEDHFRIASVTKTFVATVALQLVDEGKLSLDDRLSKFVEGIPNGDEITLRQLLGMTGGIYNFIYDPVIAVQYDQNPLLPFQPEQAIDIVRTHGQADFPPGEKFVYSDSNYILLGEIIEQVTRSTVKDEVTERIIVPLGLHETSFPQGTSDIPQPFAHGYAATAPGAPLRDVTHSNPDVAWAAGAMISTLQDLLTWSNALVAGTLLSPEMQAERLAFTNAITEPVTFGYGLGIMNLGGILGHSGGILGYGTWMMQDEATGITVVQMTNFGSTEGDPWSQWLILKLLDRLLPERGLSVLLQDLAREGATPTP
jgi:D-alanyl-D-alanine carboxypeptidase